MRVEHEYDRGGALAYLAAYDVDGEVQEGPTIPLCRLRYGGSAASPTTGIGPFGRLVSQVKVQSRTLRRVFWVVDNWSSHRARPLPSDP